MEFEESWTGLVRTNTSNESIAYNFYLKHVKLDDIDQWILHVIEFEWLAYVKEKLSGFTGIAFRVSMVAL